MLRHLTGFLGASRAHQALFLMTPNPALTFTFLQCNDNTWLFSSDCNNDKKKIYSDLDDSQKCSGMAVTMKMR